MGLLRERNGHVEILTIDRPETRNAINPELTRAFDEALDEIEADDEVRAVVITASGEKSFCSGVDLKFQAAEGVDAVISEKGGFAGIVERRFPKPLIGAVNGHALGGGLELLLACDLVIAADHAELGATEVTLGQLADGGSLIRLPNRIPLPLAAELVLVGQRVTAARAAEIGLVNEVVPGVRLQARALEVGAQIAANSPVAVRLSKALMHEAIGLSEREAWERNDDYGKRIREFPDYVEGPIAFAEKRAPVWAS